MSDVGELFDRHFPLIASVTILGFTLLNYLAVRGPATLPMITVRVIIPVIVAVYGLYLWYTVGIQGGDGR